MWYKEYKNIESKQDNFHSEAQLNTLANRVRWEWINCPVKAHDFLNNKLWQGCVADKVISILDLR